MSLHDNRGRPQRDSSSRIPSRIRIIKTGETPPQRRLYGNSDSDGSYSDFSDGEEQTSERCSTGGTTAVCYTIGSDGSKRVEIQSKPLLEALSRATKNSTLSGPEDFFAESEPFPTLFYHMGDIRKEIAKYDDQDALLDLEALEYIAAEMTPLWHKASAETFESGFVSYDMLWKLFQTGEPVLHEDEIGCLWQFIFIDVTYRSARRRQRRRSREEPCAAFTVRCLMWDNVERQLKREILEYRVSEFAGRRSITSLPIFPLRYRVDHSVHDINRSLAERGRRWWKLIAARTSCLDYNGLAFLTEQMTEDVVITRSTRRGGAQRVRVDGRMIIDEYAKEMWPLRGTDFFRKIDAEYEIHANDEQREGNQQDILSPTTELTDEQARLCPARIGCYSLSDMKLYAASVEQLSPVAWDVDAMDHLVLEEKKKDILKGLVGQHYNNEDHDRRSDLIEGKGKSLIILLHGPPGVGKTLTAECVSEAVKRPLISLSIGDLVWEDRKLQERLRIEFNRARDWEAIILLDEADVVLEARSFEDVRRNGIVSVFLRQLEYFQGVLFLTSNRVSTMDVAFQSRIQIGISFREMTPATRAQIWERLLSLNGRDKILGPSAVHDVKHRLGKFQLNGRQIRNVLNVADGLAFNEYGEPGKLKYRHIQQAVETAVEFQKMLDESKMRMKNEHTVWAMYRGDNDY